MHYYQHNVGDWAAKKQHLSLTEEGILRRLLDMYFVDEKPLPSNLPELCRKVMARTKAEREAVERVLSEFFTRDGESWRHPACDEQIKDYQDGEPERQARKQADRERKCREREDRARLFAELRRREVVVPGSTKTGELRRMLGAVTRDLDVTVTADTAIHKPVTSNREPSTENSTDAFKSDVASLVSTPQQSLQETKSAAPPVVDGDRVGADIRTPSSIPKDCQSPAEGKELSPAVVAAIDETRSIEMFKLLSDERFAQLTEEKQHLVINRWRRKNDPKFG